MIKLIAAIGPNGLIGKGDKMPWHIPEEFKHFKKTTMGHTLFMGATTLNGLPGVLPNRKIVALSFEEEAKADKTLLSLEEAKKYLINNKNSEEIIFIAGGKFIYETFQSYADEMIVSNVNTDAAGDVFLNLDFTNFEKKLIKEEKKFSVYRYYKA